MDAATVGLLTAAVGVGGTLLGAVFTQWRADARDTKRLEAEESREQMRMVTEENLSREARLFDHRRAAYLGFIQQYHRYYNLTWAVHHHETEYEPDVDTLDAFWQALSEIDLHVDPERALGAHDLFRAMYEWLFSNADKQQENQAAVEESFASFLAIARVDLGVTSASREESMRVQPADD